MNKIGFRDSATIDRPQSRDRNISDEDEQYNLVVRNGSVARRKGEKESDLMFAICVWADDDASGIGLHTPEGPKAMVARLAMFLATEDALRAMLTDACRFAEFLAALPE